MTKEQLTALAAAMLFVALQHREKPWFTRVGIAGVSGGLGFSLHAEVAHVFAWLGPASAMAIVTALGYAILDFAASVIADRAFLLDVIKGTFGRKK